MELENYNIIDYNGKKPVILISSKIGDYENGGIDGFAVQQSLLELDQMNKEEIVIWINSAGGSVIEGFTIASTILNMKTPVRTINMGIAGSIAGVIFMCGHIRDMMDYSLLMMHNVSGGSKTAIEELNKSLSILLSNNTTLTKEQVLLLMECESWLSADECLKNGFVNNIVKSSSVAFENDNYDEILLLANSIIDKNIEQINKDVVFNEMDKLEMELKNDINEPPFHENCKCEIIDGELVQESTACNLCLDMSNNTELENIKNSEIKNTIIVIEEEEEEQEDPETETECKCGQRDMVKVLENKISELESIINDKKVEELENTIENFLTDNITIGKITNESKESWKELCLTNFEQTKKVVEVLPINRVAPELFTNKTSTPQTFYEMLKFKNKK